MKVRRLVLDNYRRHQHTEFEVPDGVTAVLGPNGAGKSTLLEALGFALFGAPATRTGKELLRFDGAPPGDAVSVKLELELAGQAVTVHRELRGKTLAPNASLEVDGMVIVPPGSGSSEAVTKEIESRIGLDRHSFFTTVVARQKELSGLADDRPADRKRRILQMLGVDRIDRAIEDARRERRAAEAALEGMRGMVADAAALAAEHQQAQASVSDAKQRVTDAKTAWKQAESTLQVAADALAARQAEVDAYQLAVRASADANRIQQEAQARVSWAAKERAAVTVAVQEVASLAAQADRLPAAEATLEAARRDHEAARLHAHAAQDLARQRRRMHELERAVPSELPPLPDLAECARTVDAAQDASDSARRTLAAAEARAADARARRDRLGTLGEDAPCPTCERPLAGHLPAARAEAAEALEGSQAAVAAAKVDLDAKLAALQAAKQAFADAQGLERQHAEATRARAAFEDAKRIVDEATAALPAAPARAPDLAPLQAAVAAARQAHDARLQASARAARLPEVEQQCEAAVQAMATATQQAHAAKQALDALPDPSAAHAEAKLAHARAVQAEREAERAVHAAQAHLGQCEQAVAAAARRMEEDRKRRQAVEAQEKNAMLWGALVGSRGGGVLDGFRDHMVQRVGPAIAAEASRLLSEFTQGRYTEVLLDESYNLYVTDGGVRYTLDRFSGGETDLVHLALRLAVSRLLAERGGTELRFLALDEVFGSLDPDRRHHVLAALQGLGGLYGQVLLITHLDSLHDALDHAVQVREVDGVSRLELHAGMAV